MSSWGHRFSPVLFDDPHFEHHEYDRWAAYGQSKTANILFALALDARGRADGVRAFALHPGSIVDTGLKKYLAEEDLRAVGVLDADGRPVLDPERQLKTVEQGAATSVWCATSPLLDGKGGVYCENSDIAPLMSAQEGQEWTLMNRSWKAGVVPYAVDLEAADRLWELSERLTA
ncbi:SDR family NAD(P)-dependent oxidoreductase [Streptomyces sp. SD15]